MSNYKQTISNYNLEEKLNGDIKLYVDFGPQLEDELSEEELNIVLTIMDRACGKLRENNTLIEHVTSLKDTDELADYFNSELQIPEGELLGYINGLVKKGIFEMEGRILRFNVRNLYKHLEERLKRFKN